MSKSDLEADFARQIDWAGLPTPERELVFAKPRKYRFDFAYPDRMLAVEIHGGTWTHGAHNRGWGVARDAEKMTLAATHGWTVLVFTAKEVRDGSALSTLEDMLMREPT